MRSLRTTEVPCTAEEGAVNMVGGLGRRGEADGGGEGR